MKTSSNRRLPAVIAAIAAALLLLPAAPGAGAAGAPARAAVKDCGHVKTRNGGKALYVSTVRAKCRTGRRVARKARGKRYRALGFRCKLRKKDPSVKGKVYSCGRLHKGVGQGIGFVYRAP